MCLFASLPFSVDNAVCVSCAVTALAQDGWSSWVLCGGGLWCLCHPRERWRIVLLLEMEPEQHTHFQLAPVFFLSLAHEWGGGRVEERELTVLLWGILVVAGSTSPLSYCSCQGERGRNHCIPLFNWYKRLWIHTQQHKQFTSKKKENQKTRTSVFQLNVFTLHYLTQGVCILQAAPWARGWGSRCLPLGT